MTDKSSEIFRSLLQAAVCENVFAAAAVNYILTRLDEKSRHSLKKAVESRGADAADCVPLPMTSSGRVQICHTASRLATLALRVWKLPSVGKHAMQYDQQCSLKRSERHVCANPYHVSIGATSEGGHYCVVFGCSNNTKRRAGDLSFFSIPDKEREEQRYRLFFAAAARGDLSEFSKHHRICSSHFLASDIVTQLVAQFVNLKKAPLRIFDKDSTVYLLCRFRPNGTRQLSRSALPTLLCPQLDCVPTTRLRPTSRRSPFRKLSSRNVQPSKIRQFWDYIHSSSFSVEKLGSAGHGWQVLPTVDPNRFLFGRARLIYGNSVSDCGAHADVVELSSDLSYRLFTDRSLIDPGNYSDCLPPVADSESHLAEILKFDFPNACTVSQSVQTHES